MHVKERKWSAAALHMHVFIIVKSQLPASSAQNTKCHKSKWNVLQRNKEMTNSAFLFLHVQRLRFLSIQHWTFANLQEQAWPPFVLSRFFSLPFFISSPLFFLSQQVFVTLPKPKLFDHKLSECNDLSLSLSVSGRRCSRSRLKSLPHYPGRSQHTISIYMRFETFSNILQQDSSVIARWWNIKNLVYVWGEP